MKPYAKLMSFKRLPNLLEFFGYVYFFPGFLAGPAFNYKEYSDFIDGSLFSKVLNFFPNHLTSSGAWRKNAFTIGSIY